MRIISLNTWGGRALAPLMDFLGYWAGQDVDVFCFQEVHDTTEGVRQLRHPHEFVRWDLLPMLYRRLEGYCGYFARFEDDPHRMSQAMFIRQGLVVKDLGQKEVYRPKQPVERGSAVLSPRMLQYARIATPVGSVVIANYHGLWSADGKRDSPERYQQMISLMEVLTRWHYTPVVFCGDLNLDPDTETIESLCRAGLRNLVAEGGHTNTRTSLYRHYNEAGFSQYADYAFVSRGIEVRRFRVLENFASDHAALVLDFDCRSLQEEA